MSINKIGWLVVVLFITTMATAQTSKLADLVSELEADTKALNHTYIIQESQEYYQRFSSFYELWMKKIAAIDFNVLIQQEKVDYILLKNLVNKEVYYLNQDYTAFKEVSDVTKFTNDIFPFINQRRRGKKPNSKELAQLLQDALNSIETDMESRKSKPFKDWQTADKASNVVLSFQKGLEEAYNFYYSYDPDFTWWVKQPYVKLNEKLTDYIDFLKNNYSQTSIKDDGSGIIGKPIGENALNESLALEFIPYSPKDLIRTAEEQFVWCKNEMIKASLELGFGEDWKAALKHVKNTYVPPGEQPEAIMDLYVNSVKFIEDRDLITLPDLAKETWGMNMMTPERQKVNPFFTGGRDISISYPTLDMDHDDKMMSMRGNNPNFSFPTVQHELLPGHNLQFFMTSRHKNYRRSFSTPFWVEGWPLYWEINLWNKDFPQSPEQKLGMLFWRIHRCARIIFSLKFHLGEMTPQECITLLIDDVGHEYANAVAEVRRSFTTNYPPLYQLAYMIGGLQFYALKNEMLKKGWSEKRFHDRVMEEGSMPVELLRSLIQNIPLNKIYKTNWKFSTDFD